MQKTEQTERIRVLTVLTSFQIGGTERQVANLAKSIDLTRFDFHLGCLRNMGQLTEEFERLPIARPHFDIGRLYDLRTVWQAFRLSKYIRKNFIQIVHSYGFYPNVFVVPAARLAGASIVVASIRDRGDILTPFQRWLQKMVCRLADCVLVNAEAIRTTLIEQGYRPENIVVIRNGILLSGFENTDRGAAAREELGIDPKAPVVMVYSRLNPMKGIEYFLDAAATVVRRFPDSRFVIAGDGAIRNDLERYAADLGLSSAVIFTGFRGDIPNLLSVATLTVLPSLSEGLSNSLLESMAAGVPVIAAEVGGNPEVVEAGVSGLLVPPRDSPALAEAMIQLLEAPELAASLGEGGRRRVAKLFSMSRSIGEVETLYERLVEGHSANTRVLLVGPYPPPHGGISVHILQLRRELTARGAACHVLDPARAGKLALLSSLIRHAARGWTLHVHANGHNLRSWLLALGCGIIGRAGGGYVLTIHSGMSAAYMSSSRWRWVAALACRLARRVVCVSPAIRQAVIELSVPSEKTSIAHACVAAPHVPVCLDPRLTRWMEGHWPLFGTALFFRPEYGFDLLIAALVQLRQSYPSLGCMVMGAGEDRALAERAVSEAGMDAHVQFLGDVDHDTCLTLMSRCNVFVRPTLHDGDSVSVREALALGVTVVASRVGTRPEGVVLFEKGNVEDMVAKVQLALGRNGGKEASVDDQVDLLAELYPQTFGSRGAYAATQ